MGHFFLAMLKWKRRQLLPQNTQVISLLEHKENTKEREREGSLPELLDGHVLLTVFLHHFAHCHLKVLLSDVDTSLTQGIHSCFRTHSLKKEWIQEKEKKRKEEKKGISDPKHNERNTKLRRNRQKQTLISAPEELVNWSAIFFKSIPLIKFIFREWMRKMSNLASSPGLGNSILRSMRPGRRRAGSRMSMRFVAMSTLMFLFASKPSSWLRSSNMVLWTSLSPPSDPVGGERRKEKESEEKRKWKMLYEVSKTEEETSFSQKNLPHERIRCCRFRPWRW